MLRIKRKKKFCSLAYPKPYKHIKKIYLDSNFIHPNHKIIPNNHEYFIIVVQMAIIRFQRKKDVLLNILFSSNLYISAKQFVKQLMNMITTENLLRAAIERGEIDSYTAVTLFTKIKEKDPEYRKEVIKTNVLLRRLIEKKLLRRIWTRKRRGLYSYKPTKKALTLYLPSSEIARKRLISERYQEEAKQLTKKMISHTRIRKSLQLVALFGSVARREADERSDVDILIVVDADKIRALVEDIALDYYMKHGTRFTTQILISEEFIKTAKSHDAATIRIFHEGIVLYGLDYWKKLKREI